MGMRARLSATVFALFLGCDDASEQASCEDRQDEVSVDEPLEALDGESAAARFDRAAGPWDCTITWLELPVQFGTSEPPAGSSPLELVLERTSDTARYQGYALTLDEERRSSGCKPPSLDVPCSLALRSDDGGLDESFDCELRLQGENTLVTFELEGYEFVGTHLVEFVDGVTKDSVGLNVAVTPGPAPMRVDATLVESGTQSGSGADPYLTTAVIECALLPAE